MDQQDPMSRLLKPLGAAALAGMLALAGCTSPQKAPATADVAVSRNAVENAVSAGAAELAPAEITAARDKMVRANQALAAKDYKLARELAIQAQADAKLAQSKAASAKSTAAAAALDADLRVLREEVERANSATPAPAPAATSATTQ
jgi:outer membrane murein-binding lipoprotein Lpp